MTTDELVANFIRIVENDGVYDEQFVRKVYSDEGVEVFSLALNDETRDVRYVKVDFSCPEVEVFEVKPVTVMRTEYRRV